METSKERQSNIIPSIAHREAKIVGSILVLLSFVVGFGAIYTHIVHYPKLYDFSFEPSINNISLLIATLSNLTLLVITFFFIKKLSKNLFWFVLYLATLTLWGLFCLFQDMCTSIEAVTFWSIFTSIIGTYVVMWALSFILDQVYPSRAIGAWLSAMVTGMLLVDFIGTSSVIINNNPNPSSSLWIGYEAPFGPGGWLWSLWISCLGFITITILILHYRRQTAPLQKKQARAFVIGMILFLLGGLIFDVGIPSIDPGQTTVPPVAMYVSTVQAIFFCYGLIRYRLFTVNQAIAAPKILQTISEPVVVTDAGYHSLFSNARSAYIIGDAAINEKAGLLSTIFTPEIFGNMSRRILEEINTGQVIEFNEVQLLNTKWQYANISVSRITDDENKLAGIVWVFNNTSRYKNTQLDATSNSS